MSSSSLSWSQSLPQLPSQPGVYWFTDANEQILYVGKAKNLKSRIRSYLQITSHNPKTYQLVTTAHHLHFQVLPSELHAIITESALIRTHQPQFNILSKDDKTPLYLILTTDHFPTLIAIRQKTLTTTYANLNKTNIFGPFASGLDARRVIKLSRRIFKFCNQARSLHTQSTPCFYYHIGLCSGACLGLVTKSAYANMIHHLKLLLRGKNKSLLRSLTQQMHQLSTDAKFEQAAIIRDQIRALTNLHLLSHDFAPDVNLPILSADAGHARTTNLKYLLRQTGFISANHQLNRIEAYDISNTSGTNATSSMVVFNQGFPHKSAYRHFSIKYTKGPNDPAMIKETLQRRLNHPEWGTPDLILIDGGKTQLNAALSVTKHQIPTLSLAKNPDRLLIPSKTDPPTFITIKLNSKSPAANLLTHLRDESHRFAKNYHTHLRSQSLTLS